MAIAFNFNLHSLEFILDPSKKLPHLIILSSTLVVGVVVASPVMFIVHNKTFASCMKIHIDRL